ncbi:MAG: PorT family protein [Balneolaceae bacterium]|nr:MAG: PorT family protein [Balneolaceae bacterium]
MKNMKKITLSILLTSLFLFIGMSGLSQAQGLVNFGIKGGVNIANISFDDFDDNSSRTGFTIGAIVDIGIPMFPVGLETGLYYSQKGTTFDISETVEGMTLTADATIKLDYLKIPVLAKVNFGPPGPFSPHFVAGPYAGFILNAETESSFLGETFTEDISDDVESMDFGLMVGLGADLNLMVTKISIQGRYSFGLTDVFEDDSSKNRVLSIVAGFSF